MDSNKEFGEVKAKLDALAAVFEDFRSETRTWQLRCEDMLSIRLGGRLDTHSARLRSLEIWRGWITGAFGVLVLIWAVFRFAVEWWHK